MNLQSQHWRGPWKQVGIRSHWSASWFNRFQVQWGPLSQKIKLENNRSHPMPTSDLRKHIHTSNANNYIQRTQTLEKKKNLKTLGKMIQEALSRSLKLCVRLKVYQRTHKTDRWPKIWDLSHIICNHFSLDPLPCGFLHVKFTHAIVWTKPHIPETIRWWDK